jgi:hypothetical protein
VERILLHAMCLCKKNLLGGFRAKGDDIRLKIAVRKKSPICQNKRMMWNIFFFMQSTDVKKPVSRARVMRSQFSGQEKVMAFA